MQYRTSEFSKLGVATERTAGLAAIYPRAETTTTPMLLAEPQTADQYLSGPLIIRTVSLKFVSARLDIDRSRIDAVIRRFRGYIDTLTMRSDNGSAQSLSATLRIPADQLTSALNELKTLGKVVEETESSQDATAGYTDLVARLSNARRTEQRLLGLLSERAGKLGEVVQVEKEIGEVRERIERMEGQQRRIENQVRFALVKLEWTQEGQIQFPAIRVQMLTALSDGYQTAIGTSIAAATAALRYGPTVIVFSLLLLPFVVVVYRRFAPSRRTA
jgi:hypothetical protein